MQRNKKEQQHTHTLTSTWIHMKTSFQTTNLIHSIQFDTDKEREEDFKL